MKAIILAAGFATRLYPLTENKAKPLLPIGDKVMIDFIIDKINDLAVVDEIYVVTNDKFFDDFHQWALMSTSPKKITIISDGTDSNETRLGAVGDMAFVVNQKAINDDLLVIAGDNLFEFSLSSMFEFYSQKGRSTIALFDIQQKEKAAKKFGIVEIDDTGKIIGFEEKPEQPKTSLVSTACYLFTKEDVALLHQCVAELNPDNLGDFIRWLTSKNPVYGWGFKEDWYDIGSHEQYQDICKRFT